MIEERHRVRPRSRFHRGLDDQPLHLLAGAELAHGIVRIDPCHAIFVEMDSYRLLSVRRENVDRSAANGDLAWFVHAVVPEIAERLKGLRKGIASSASPASTTIGSPEKASGRATFCAAEDASVTNSTGRSSRH
jgi:hypothetical protein